MNLSRDLPKDLQVNLEHYNLNLKYIEEISYNRYLVKRYISRGISYGIHKTHKNDQTIADFSYHRGKRHGNCKEWYNNGLIMCDFNYHTGEKHGNCKQDRSHASEDKDRTGKV